MQVKYVIIQAGGLGTRLGDLTKNKPKALVPVRNKPIIFHIFDAFKGSRFIIVGDYKYNVLERYLRNYASVEYLLIRTDKKGNAAGIKDALAYIPNGQHFAIVWNDLIPGKGMDISSLKDGCYVGVTDRFGCSWQFSEGIMEKKKSYRNGVGGLFLFEEKKQLQSIPGEGSFAKWLSESDIMLNAFSLEDSFEAGTLEAIYKADSVVNRCRPYNHMNFFDDRVIKTGLTQEAEQLLDREKQWYRKLLAYGFSGIPKIYSYSPLTMSRIDGDNIFKADLTVEQKKNTIDKLVDTLNELHSFENPGSDLWGLEEEYYTKTLKRIESIRDIIPFTNDRFIKINGMRCRNLFYFEDDFQNDIRYKLFDTQFGPIHGDCTLTNTLIDRYGKIYFIDARGYFGKREIYGDIYYDWSKLYYSINGCFDQFNIRNFDFYIGEDEVTYRIHENGWSDLTEYFLSKIPDCDCGKIKLIHAIIWMSLASHCSEDFDSLCLAFYNGLRLWNEWRQEEYESNA